MMNDECRMTEGFQLGLFCLILRPLQWLIKLVKGRRTRSAGKALSIISIKELDAWKASAALPLLHLANPGELLQRIAKEIDENPGKVIYSMTMPRVHGTFVYRFHGDQLDLLADVLRRQAERPDSDHPLTVFDATLVIEFARHYVATAKPV